MINEKLEKRLIDYVDTLELNYSLLGDVNYIYQVRDKIHNDVFGKTYSGYDKESNNKKKKEHEKKIYSILENKYEEYLDIYKKYLPRENNLDEAIVEIIKILLNNINKEIKTNYIYETMKNKYTTDLVIKDLTKRALSNIRCLYMSDYRVENRINTFYKVNLDTWFKEPRRYYIKNTELLKNISPLLVAYLKSNRGLSTDDFFEIIEKIIEEFINPIEKSNEKYSVEHKILNAINNSNEITIIIDGSVDNVANQRIFPIRIIINNNNSKIIEYNKVDKDGIDTKRVNSILLSNIYLINDKGIPAKDFLKTIMKPTTKEWFKSVNRRIQSSLLKFEVQHHLNDFNIENEEQIILECNTMLIDYFTYKPLKKQQIFKTENDLKAFKEFYNRETKDNRFYVVATDTITNASSSVLKCLGEVKIITPTSLNDFILNKIQKHNSFL